MQPMLHDAAAASSACTASPAAIGRGGWLLLIYHVPAQPSSARSAIWRDVRRLGAVSLQHGVCLLPDSEPCRAAYDRLVRRVEAYGGEATVLETTSPDATWHERMVARDNTVSFANRTWQLERSKLRATLAGCRVTIHEHLDETVSITFGPHLVGRFNLDALPLLSRPKTPSVELLEKSRQKAA